MIKAFKASSKNRSNSSISEPLASGGNTSQRPTVQSTTSCLHIKKEKFKSIIVFGAIVILITIGVIIVTFIILKKKAETAERMHSSINVTVDTKWAQNGITVAGGYGDGELLYHLAQPSGIDIDDDGQCFYIAESNNHRIVEWKFGSSDGEIVAGGNGKGNRINQLDGPSDVVLDKNKHSLIICDRGNLRLVRWPRRNGRTGEVMISNLPCHGLAIDNNGDLYISDRARNVVKRWTPDGTNGIIVAGNSTRGHQLSQLSSPTFIFVDQNYSVYVSDSSNHRVVKWMKNATEGIVVAGGKGPGDNLTQLNDPCAVIVDHLESVYVAEYYNKRIMRWLKDSREGSIVVGGNGQGEQANQFTSLADISFDRKYDLYVVDRGNHRIQKFLIQSN